MNISLKLKIWGEPSDEVILSLNSLESCKGDVKGWFWLSSVTDINKCFGMLGSQFSVLGFAKISLTSKEKNQITHFEISPKKNVPGTDKQRGDIESQVYSNSKQYNKGGFGPVSILEGMHLSYEPKMENDLIYLLDDGGYELAVTESTYLKMKNRFEDCFDGTPIGCSHSGEPVILLIANKFALPANMDSSVGEHTSSPEIDSLDTRYFQSGLKTFDGLSQMPEITRERDPFSPCGSPGWFFSKTALDRAEFIDRKSYSLYPLLEKGTDVEIKYREKWDDIIQSINTNPKNRVQIY